MVFFIPLACSLPLVLLAAGSEKKRGDAGTNISHRRNEDMREKKKQEEKEEIKNNDLRSAASRPGRSNPFILKLRVPGRAAADTRVADVVFS